MDYYDWRKEFEEILELFSKDQATLALQQIESIIKVTEDFPPKERLYIIGSISQTLEKIDRKIDAIYYYEKLIQLNKKYDPNTIETARDLVHLGGLYGELDRIQKQYKVFSQAGRIYKNLYPKQSNKLEPDEIKKFVGMFKRTKELLEIRNKQIKHKPSNIAALERILQTLERDIDRIEEYPECVLQQIINDLNFYNEGIKLNIIKKFKTYLETKDHPWIELKDVLGPGQKIWKHQYLVRTTSFPLKVECFIPILSKKLVAVLESGEIWVAEISGKAHPLSLPFSKKKEDTDLLILDQLSVL